MTAAPTPAAGGPDAADAGILIVDDRPENLIALRAALEQLGEPLECASSGEEALRALLHQDFAVILLDVRMRGIDGLQTAQLIRARPRTRDTPIIFLTAEPTDVAEIALAYETTGAVDYLVKPFEPEILRAKVRVLVQLKYERAERWRQAQARAEAEASAKTIRTLQILSDAALSHLDVGGLVAELLQRSCAVFDLDGAGLLLRSESAGELTVAATAGVRVPLGVDSPLRPAVDSGDPLARLAVRRVISRVGTGELSTLGDLPEDSVASCLVVPLAPEKELLGVLVLGGSESATGSIDLELLGLAADRMAMAIDHAQQAEQGRALVETLQRNLLPENLPHHPRLQLTARYLPSGAVREVGGDWYDAVALGEDHLAIMIGDVVGHGMRAATTMSELRSALRAYILEGHTPARALHRLDRLARITFGPRMTATALCLVVDIPEQIVTIASAGHPPPALQQADGRVRLLQEQSSLPLGLDSVAPQEITEPLQPGDTLVLFTDGLVERPHESLDDGFERLLVALADAPASLDRLCDHVIDTALQNMPTRDDAALVAVRLLAPHAGPFELTLPAVRDSVPIARHRLRGWMNDTIAELALPQTWTHDVELAFTEACSNAVRHAYGPQDASFTATAVRTDAWLTLEIADQGRWRPPRDAHGGRGLPLIEALCDDLLIHRTEHGTLVTIRFRLPPSEPSQ